MKNKRFTVWHKIGAICGAGLLAAAASTAAVNSGDATLDNLEIKIDGQNIVTGFSSNNKTYTIELGEDASSMATFSAVPKASDAVVDISVNGTTLTNHSLASLTGGDNVVTYTVKSGSRTETYTVNIKTPQVVRENYFTWKNANIYFVLTDRFYDGDPSNNNSYHRKRMSGDADVATFHGGDIKGLTEKLDYLDKLGVNAIWITAPYEQMHGWTGGKNDAFPHYAFHGYYALDWTYMDRNMGTIEEMKTFVTEAHKRGIRVVMDIVMNHTGYGNLDDAVDYDFGNFNGNPQAGWVPSSTPYSMWAESNAVSFNANEQGKWGNWWGPWVRAFGDRSWASNAGFAPEGGSDYTKPLAGLPDIVTERTQSVDIPPFLKKKWNAEKGGDYDKYRLPNLENWRAGNKGAPADYIVNWLAGWVEYFGIDGFRCDTAKHLEKSRWAQLKNACKTALRNWRNSDRADEYAKNWDEDFWMTGEAFGWDHGDVGYFTEGGFDSMINFAFNSSEGSQGRTPSTEDWKYYANYCNGSNGRQVLNYVSSHDTGLHRPGDQKKVATMLLLCPGGAQIYYGDETSRPYMSGCGGDQSMQTRSDFNWSAVDNDDNKHWQKIGQFRRRNAAVGAGSQTDLGDNTYGRKFTEGSYSNAVVIKLNTSAGQSYTVSVNGFFNDGERVMDGYNTDNSATVSGGKVTLTASGPVLLIEPYGTIGDGPTPPNPPRPRSVVTATPAPSSFTDNVTVSLSASPVATIYYTIDGSTPSTSSLVYMSPLTFSQTTTVKTLTVLNGVQNTQSFTWTKQGDNPGPQPDYPSLNTSYYKTNPDGKRGTNKTINMSISNMQSSTALSNWTDAELIAQGVANDVCQMFKGGHEYPFYDTYALYAAYDSKYLYLAAQYVNVFNGDKGNSKPYNSQIQISVALDVDPNKDCTGEMEAKSGDRMPWLKEHTMVFKNGMDVLVNFHAKPGGTPGIFLPKEDGKFSYDEGYCMPFEANSVGYQDGLLPSIQHIYGQDQYGYDPKLLEGESGFVDLKSKHSDDYHTIYEIKIPLATLGITEDYIKTNGIGAMWVSTHGASATGSIPYDPTVYDCVLEEGKWGDNTSKEKDDVDTFTYGMARIGGSGDIPVTNKPRVTASPNGGTFTDNVTVSLSVTPAGVPIHYSTSGTATASSPVYSSALTFSETTTLSTYVENSDGSNTQSFTYTKGGGDDPTPDGYYVYFNNSSNWTPYVWAWNDTENCCTNGSWPGDAMTQKDGKYYWAAPSGKVPTMIIISNNGGDKAGNGDLKFVNKATYNPDGSTGDNPGPNPPNPNGMTIYYDNSSSNWSSVKVHYFGGSDVSTWPGVDMTKHKDNIYKYVVPSGTTGLVFNNGSGDQGGDLKAVDNHLYDKNSDKGVYNGGDDPNPGPNPPNPSGVKVFYKGNWSSVNAYIYKAGSNPIVQNAAWPGASMTKESGKDYFSYTVPEGLASGAKVIFNNGTDQYPTDVEGQECGLDLNGSSMMLDGTSWNSFSEGPQKPSISISPNGGKVKGSSTIAVNIANNATSITASFNGRSLTLNNGSNNVTVSSYLNDGATGSLSVSATNDLGTTTANVSFTRDDSTPVYDNTLTGDHRELSIYQVMVASFQHGNGGASGYSDLHGPNGHTKNGNLRGIINALDYIKGLGMNAIWMTPIFNSAGCRTFGGGTRLEATGYYATNFFEVDPKFGSLDEFKELVNKAHEKGMYIILDGVFGHSGADGSTLTSPNGKKCYVKGQMNVANVRGSESGNIAFPESLDYFKEVIRYWMELGVDGWRLDQCYQVYQNGHNYWKDLREECEAVARERKNRGEKWGTLGFMVGEDWANANGITTTRQNGLKSVMDFDGKDNLVGLGYGVGSIGWFLSTDAQGRGYESGVNPTIFLSNHDMARPGDKIDVNSKVEELMTRHAAVAAYSGPTCTYYGDEIGDKSGSGCSDGDKSRTSGRISGFNGNEQKLHDYVAKVFKARASNPALWRGTAERKGGSNGAGNGLEVITKTDSQTGNKVICIFSQSNQSVNIGGSGVDLINGGNVSGTVNVQAWVPAFIKMN